MSIRQASDKVLVKCHAGCAQADIIEALKARGLWEGSSSGEWLDWHSGIRYHRDWGRPECSYTYTDESTVELYRIVRFVPKDFRQLYRREDGVWKWKKHPCQVLYHLPEVLEAAIVFVVEGEKDVETLRDWGFCATTNAGGAKAPWLPEFTAALAGREVILVPDADEPGRRRVATIANALLGHAARIIIWAPEDGSKDITDWFKRGHSEVELIAQVEGEEVRR